jgi:glycosyltransferase involved in cell wall biosynthesis
VPTADGRREGLPVVLLEAMAVGVPVVASRLSGIPEAVIDGQTGLLVDPADVAGLSRAISRLARDPRLASQLARRGTQLVEADFDADASAARLVELFGGGRP